MYVHCTTRSPVIIFSYSRSIKFRINNYVQTTIIGTRKFMERSDWFLTNLQLQSTRPNWVTIKYISLQELLTKANPSGLTDESLMHLIVLQQQSSIIAVVPSRLYTFLLVDIIKPIMTPITKILTFIIPNRLQTHKFFRFCNGKPSISINQRGQLIMERNSSYAWFILL